MLGSKIKAMVFSLFLFQCGYALAGEIEAEQSSTPLEQSVYGSEDDALNHSDENNGAVDETDSTSVDSSEKSSAPSLADDLIDFIIGEPVKDGVMYLPFGIHTKTKNKDVAKNHLVGIVYNSLIFGTFINSFHDRVWSIALTRNIISYHGFGVDYFIGALYGYKGQLSTVSGIPLRNTFLFKKNLNPVASLDAYYELSDHLQLQAMFTPLVVLGGVKYNF